MLIIDASDLSINDMENLTLESLFIMFKQGENPLWDYFKISNEDVSKAVCILCKVTLAHP